MWRFAGKRGLAAILVLFAISVLVFLIFFATPGVDPAARIAGRNASQETLAQAAGMSPFHLHRVFKAVTGVTPRAYAAAHRASHDTFRFPRKCRSSPTKKRSTTWCRSSLPIAPDCCTPSPACSVATA